MGFHWDLLVPSWAPVDVIGSSCFGPWILFWGDFAYLTFLRPLSRFGHFGILLGTPFTLLLVPFGTLWVPFGPLLGSLGYLWGLFGLLLAPFGPLWAPFGPLLGSLGYLLVPFGCIVLPLTVFSSVRVRKSQICVRCLRDSRIYF